MGRPADPRQIDAARAFRLIMFGLAKKVIVAEQLASWIVKPVFNNPTQYGAVDNLVGVYAYAIQIYADFSGYTDIAIGLALLLGIQLPAELQLAVHGRDAAGLLAPLAHDALALAARLPLHRARRQPEG